MSYLMVHESFVVVLALEGNSAQLRTPSWVQMKIPRLANLYFAGEPIVLCHKYAAVY
jgi:hypothetical protein